MQKLSSKGFRWTQDSDGGWLCIRCSNPQKVLAEIQEGKTYDVEIKLHRERRSMDANAYFWVLADKLADKLSSNGPVISKTDIYRRLIPDVPGASQTVTVAENAAEALVMGWEHNGLGWLTETYRSVIPGFINVTLYYGSSVYDTKQMSRLINLLVDECKAQGIETMTPAELMRLEGYDAE